VKTKEIQAAAAQQVTSVVEDPLVGEDPSLVGEDPLVQQLSSKEGVPKSKAKRKSSKSSKSKVESTLSSDEPLVVTDAALRSDDTLPTTEDRPIISTLTIEEATVDEQSLTDELKSFSSLFKSDASADSKLPLELETINDELLAELQLLNEDWFLEDDASNEQLFAEEQSFTRSLLKEIDHTGRSGDDIPFDVASGDMHTEVIYRQDTSFMPFLPCVDRLMLACMWVRRRCPLTLLMPLRTAWPCWRLFVDSNHHRYSLVFSLCDQD